MIRETFSGETCGFIAFTNLSSAMQIAEVLSDLTSLRACVGFQYPCLSKPKAITEPKYQWWQANSLRQIGLFGSSRACQCQQRNSVFNKSDTKQTDYGHLSREWRTEESPRPGEPLLRCESQAHARTWADCGPGFESGKAGRGSSLEWIKCK